MTEYIIIGDKQIKKTNSMKRVEKQYNKEIKDVLHDMYTLQKKTIEQIAEELIVSKGTVHGWLKEFDIKTRSLTFI